MRLVSYAGAGGVASYQYRIGDRSEARPYALPRVEAAPACAGLNQRDPEALLYGLGGGPGARDLPDPVEDVRTETRAVGW